MRPFPSKVLVLLGAVACSSQVLEPIVKGGGSTWCASQTTSKTAYCRDFDDGRNYDVGWSSIYSEPMGIAFATVECGNHASDSAPCSLLVTTPQVLAGSSASFQLQQLVESNSGVSLQFDLEIVNYDSGSPNVGLIAVYLQTTKAWWLSLDIVGGEFQLTETQDSPGDAGNHNYTTHKGGQPILGSWHQVNLQLIANSSPLMASLSYDGNEVITPVTITPPATPTQLLTQWGVNYVQGPAQPMRLSYDNIKIDAL